MEIDLTEDVVPPSKPITLGFVTSDESMKQDEKPKRVSLSAQTAKVAEFDIGDQRQLTAQASKEENLQLLSLPPIGSLSQHLQKQTFEQEKSELSKDYSSAASHLMQDMESFMRHGANVQKESGLYRMDRLTKMAQQIAIKSNLENIQKSALKELGNFIIEMMSNILGDLITISREQRNLSGITNLLKSELGQQVSFG
jgi:hypothetical protein